MRKTIFILVLILLTLTQCSKKEETDLTKTIVGTYYNSTKDYYIHVGKKNNQTVTISLQGSTVESRKFDSVIMNTSTTFTLNQGDTSTGQIDTIPVYTTHTGSGHFNAGDILLNILAKTYNDSTHTLMASDSSLYAGLIVITR